MNLILKGYWSNNPISVDEVIQNPELVLRVPVSMVTLSADVDKAYVDEQDSLLGNEFATALQALDDKKANATAVTQALSTKADLIDGVIPANQLPSFVDDVLNFPDLVSFPSLGEDSKIYVAEDVNKTYRWGGISYVEIGDGGVALGETSSTAYRGDNGKIAYDHALSQGNPHNATTTDIDEGIKLFFTEDRVKQTVLTGLDTTTATTVLDTDQLLAAIGKLQSQINDMGGGSSGEIAWVNAASIGLMHPSIAPTNNFIELARINGMLWIRGSFKNTASILYESQPYLLRIDDIQYKVVSRNQQGILVAGITARNGASTKTVIDFKTAYTICVDAATASTCMQYFSITLITLAETTSFYNIPPTCLGVLVIQ